MTRVLRQLAAYPWRLAASVALAAAMVLSGIGLLATSGYLIARAALHPDTVLALMVAVTGVRFFGLARAAVRYLERLASHDLTLRLLAALRRAVYARLVPLAPLGLGRDRSADLVGRLVEDVDELQTLYLRLVAPALAAVVVIATAVALTALLSPAAAWVTLGLLIAGGAALPAALAALGRGVGRREARLQARRRVLLVDAIQGAQELWVYGRTGAYGARMAALDRRLDRAARRRAALEGLRDGAGAWLALAAPVAAVAAALPAVAAGTLRPLLLVPLALGVSATFEAVQPLAEAFERWERSRASAERLEEVLDREPAVADPARPQPLPPAPALSVTGAYLRYRERTALANMDLELGPGRRVAVVGRSGAGKSSLLRLLVRFADPDSGSVRLGGVDLRSLRQDDLRSRLAVVPQTVVLFNTTVRANLRLARPGAPEDALWRALRAAELADAVATLPNGLDTLVGEYGNRLSAGERQRLAVARALLKDAPLLLLDEPTANLDALTERRLLRRLLAPDSARGVLLVTHRLGQLDLVDEIVVLEAGRVVQRGSHRRLAVEPGPYRTMLRAQEGQLEGAALSPDASAAS